MNLKELWRRAFQIKKALTNLLQLADSLDLLRVNQGLILSRLNETSVSEKLADYEFRVFSQNGEDGILQKLVKSIEIKNKTFIEFGVEDFFESNLRF